LSVSRLSDAVNKFINESIFSVGQLEVLLLLYRNRQTRWTAKAIGEELRSSEIAAAQQLRDLESRRLIIQKTESGLSWYELDTNSSDQLRTIEQLEKYYEDYKVSIISLIYEKPIDSLRQFAEAFKLKKDK
jgi:predicted transcriptional regulator